LDDENFKSEDYTMKRVIQKTSHLKFSDLKRFGSELFKPFSRFNSTIEGTGMGLYIVKNIIEQNGGHIDVTSIPGKGTSFYCYLKEYGLS
jgi:light-regulated signal transduction histidine kinase (bacteriophytochrome)